jgi:hypothetical protein
MWVAITIDEAHDGTKRTVKLGTGLIHLAG